MLPHGLSLSHGGQASTGKVVPPSPSPALDSTLRFPAGEVDQPAKTARKNFMNREINDWKKKKRKKQVKEKGEIPRCQARGAGRELTPARPQPRKP